MDQFAVDAIGGAITLSWNGSDVDNDITSYDVYLGTKATPDLSKRHVRQAQLQNDFS